MFREWLDGNLEPQAEGLMVSRFHSYVLPLFLLSTVEALLMDTLVSGELYLQPPSQNIVFLDSHTNSVFLYSSKWPAPVMDTFFAFGRCPLKRASSVV